MTAAHTGEPLALHELGGVLFTFVGPPDKQPAFPRYDIFEDVGDDEELHVVDHFAFGGLNVAPCHWFQTHENVMDPYHVFILHNAMSGPQFDPRLEIWPDIDWQLHECGATSSQDRVLDDGTTLHRVTETRFPNVRVVATPTLPAGPKLAIVGDSQARALANNLPSGATTKQSRALTPGLIWPDLALLPPTCCMTLRPRSYQGVDMGVTSR